MKCGITINVGVSVKIKKKTLCVQKKIIFGNLQYVVAKMVKM